MRKSRKSGKGDGSIFQKIDPSPFLSPFSLPGLGVADLPDCLSYEGLKSGTLVPIMTRYPPPPAGAYVVRPPGQHPARKIHALTELLIESFGQSPHFAKPVSQ